MAASCGGKFGATGLVATRKWNLGGKQSGRIKFATRVELKQLGTDWWLAVVVANLALQVQLPPESRIRVANRVAVSNLPPE